MIRIDAHHHVWRLDRGAYGWPTPDLPSYRHFTLDDLRPLLGDVTATILVQAAPTEAETAFLLQTARDSSDLVADVVGWSDLAAPSAPDRIAELATGPAAQGVAAHAPRTLPIPSGFCAAMCCPRSWQW